MRRSNKHQMQKVNMYPLNGGINVSAPPEQIATNEMQSCQNFWYEIGTQKLVGRGGLKQVSTYSAGNIRSMYYDIDTNLTFVFLDSRNAYSVMLSDVETGRKSLSKVTGENNVHCTKFKDKLFVASGDSLQFYDYGDNSTLATLLMAPKCDLVFYRYGRLAAIKVGNSDRINLSSMGDATSDVAWNEDTNDVSMAQWIDIGPDDGGDIMDVVPLSTDMIILKSNGKAYQFVGDSEPSSWVVYNTSNKTDVTAGFTAGAIATNLGQEVAFLSLRGLRMLSTTQDYGNIATSDIGDKFNKLITTKMYEPELYDMRRHKTLMIRPTSDRSYWIAYNYAINAATTIKFGMPIACILETKDDVFVASGNAIYRWTVDATKDGEIDIEYSLSPRDLIGSDEMLVKAIDTKFTSDHAGVAKVSIGDRLKVDMPTNARRKVRCNHSSDVVHLEVNSNSRFEVDHIMLDMVDL